MKVASWNVNSIRARLDRLLAWLERERPDVLCLQELKTASPGFPFAALEAAGYLAVVHGQKTYNGVAILARSTPTEVVRGLGDDADDPQARLIAATVDGVRVLSAYVPNGAEVGSEKYAYKREWLARLRALLAGLDLAAVPFALCGDLNIARDERDVSAGEDWSQTVLFHPEMRAALAELLGCGLVDSYRLRHQAGGAFSWWDYRQASFRRDRGVRIDYVLVSEPLAARCVGAGIDREERAGDKPSDHAPVWAEFDPPQ